MAERVPAFARDNKHQEDRTKGAKSQSLRGFQHWTHTTSSSIRQPESKCDGILDGIPASDALQLQMALLSDAKARNLGPGGAAVAHGGVVGLTLIPSATSKGQGKWVLRYVSPTTGKRRNAGLGSYPETSIATAAKNARQMREDIAAGKDPLESKAIELARPRTPTVIEASERLHDELRPGWKNAKHAQQWINTLRQYAFPLVGTLPLDQVQPRHIADVLRPIWLSKPETASRVKQRLHAVMAWGWAHGINQANPVDVVDHLLPQQPGKAMRVEHQPAMPWKQLPDFVAENLRADRNFEPSRRALLFLILTAARSGEVRGAHWSEINFEQRVWTIPASRMKTQQPHRVPLTEEACALLRAQQGQHDEIVFPSARGRTAMSDMALTSLLRRLKAPSDVDDRIATAHGFRSSFRDWCSENGFARDLAERALAHTVQNKVEAAYHRTDLLEQRRLMMQEWSRFLLRS